MSLILEALRKSEAERRRGLAPDVAMELPPTPASRPRSMVAWLLPVLMVAVLLILAGWWVRREPADAASTTTAEATDKSSEVAPEATLPMPQAVPRIEPRPPVVASLQAPEIPATAVAPPAPMTVTIPSAVTRAPPFQPAPTPAPPSPIPAPARPLPQASPTGVISNDTSMLPPVKLSMLMWDDVPSKRFVILNGQRMGEGDRYGAITVIAIERGGVVVEGNGAKARVPLP